MKRRVETTPLIGVVLDPDPDSLAGRIANELLATAYDAAGDMQKSALAGRLAIGIQGPVREMA